MTIRAKLAATLLRAIQKVLNKDVDIPDIQRRYSATKGRILRLHITDVNMFANFKIENGRVDMITCEHPNATAYFSLDTLLHLMDGEIAIKEQDGYVHNESYTPFDAWRRGELVIISENPNEGWLSDLTLFGREIYQKAFPAIKDKLGGKSKKNSKRKCRRCGAPIDENGRCQKCGAEDSDEEADRMA